MFHNFLHNFDLDGGPSSLLSEVPASGIFRLTWFHIHQNDDIDVGRLCVLYVYNVLSIRVAAVHDYVYEKITSLKPYSGV